MQSITRTGHHAAEQLLLRERHLCFEGVVDELVSLDKIPQVSASDLELDPATLSKALEVDAGIRIHGAKPTDHIFDRPILCCRIRKDNARAPWDNRASLSVFPNALQAVQQLSYGSVKVRHAGFIDDILIANNIASSADGERTESYNFLWSWEDKANEIQRHLERERSAGNNSNSLFNGVTRRLSRTSEPGGPMDFFGLRCAGMCAADTTA